MPEGPCPKLYFVVSMKGTLGVLRLFVSLQDVFTFVHPNNDIIIDNSRSSHLTFDRTGELLDHDKTTCRGLQAIFKIWPTITRIYCILQHFIAC
jgi:hypothetical protein